MFQACRQKRRGRPNQSNTLKKETNPFQKSLPITLATQQSKATETFKAM
jgi:hypothetical protein